MTEELLTVLERARALGFLGPGSLRVHLEHARGYLAGLEGVSGTVADLGSGGGIPGLVVAIERTDLQLRLVDANERRVSHLYWAVAHLGLSDRVSVTSARVESVTQDPGWRGAFDAVLARGFAPTPITSELAAHLLRPGGRLVVSVPERDGLPADSDLARVGLVSAVGVGEGILVAVRTDVPAPAPRSWNAMKKRPAW